MNEQLKFSWGHIIAFLALIAISYITFVGEAYWARGSFTKAGFWMIVIDIMLFFIFIGGQMMKAIGRRFRRWIWVERICIFASPITFILCLLPYFHFWTVQSHEAGIVKDFNSVITGSKGLFTDYEEYAQERTKNYTMILGIKSSAHPDKSTIQKNVMLKTLELQLLSDNYDSLKREAIAWIENANQGASALNVFLLGNVKEIKTAINNWNKQLVEFSSKTLSNEGKNVKLFDGNYQKISTLNKGLEELADKFTHGGPPTFISIILALFLYLCLILPYVLQDRHTNNPYRLIGKAKWIKDNDDGITFTLKK